MMICCSVILVFLLEDSIVSSVFQSNLSLVHPSKTNMDPEHDGFKVRNLLVSWGGFGPDFHRIRLRSNRLLPFLKLPSGGQGPKRPAFWGSQSKGETRKDEHMAVGSELWLNTWDVDKVL